jgi:hypothetical protein
MSTDQKIIENREEKLLEIDETGTNIANIK